MTRTWSVPSTATIFISPSARSSTASRSRRLTGATGAGAASGRGCGGRSGGGRGGARVPLRFEQLAERLPGRLERHAGDDRLEEAEDDELAGLLGIDPAALEVEQLALV